ncbi:MAG: hypothetical protein LKJ83_10680 [Eubacteriaceae bacterium]|jgi:4-hydroxy-tetrahydrodipicolinate reductase|nr:hypothetical protein [Eubacteriaceae bacterium]
MKLKTAICGFGNAGRNLAQMIMASDQYSLEYVLCSEQSENAGRDAGELLGMKHSGIPICRGSELAQVQSASPADVMIDFSVPEMSPLLVSMCAGEHINVVICTTNHADETLAGMKADTEESGIGTVIASNLTIGINLLINYAKQLSKTLPDFDISIHERHRSGKPPVTGTAKQIAKATGRDDVPISWVRAGGYIGLHEITAASQNERISIVHESFSRSAFSDGALLAAKYAAAHPGFYFMSDVVDSAANNAD